MKSGKSQQQFFLLPRWNLSSLALIIVLSSTLLSSVMVKVSASDSDVRYYAVPKTCDIYNYGYSYNDGSERRENVRNCIDTGDIKELAQSGDYSVCKADVHGEGWWGECDSGCSVLGGDKRKCEQPIDTDSETGSKAHTDCRPDKPLCNQVVLQCVFPFKHEGIEYNTCTTAGDSGGNRTFSWCATKKNNDGEWILRAECEAVTFPLNAKAEAKNGNVEMSVTLSQNTATGSTTYEGDFTGLDVSKTYGLTVVQATEVNDDCSRPRTAEKPPRGVGMALHDPNEEAEYPDRLGDLVPESSGELVVNKTDGTGHIEKKKIDKILKEGSTLYGHGEDMGKSLLGRVLVLHEKCDGYEDEGKKGKWGANCPKLACARFEMVPQESNEWIALILIIVFCVLIIIIILAVIIYCCIKHKCCGKYTTVPVNPEDQKPLDQPGSSPDPESPVKPSKSPLDGDDIPFADRPDLFTQTSDIGSIFLKEKYGDGAYKSRESLSNLCGPTSP